MAESQTSAAAAKIQEYLDDQQLQLVLQTTINDLCKLQPKNAFDFLVTRLMPRCSLPTVDHLAAREVLDSRGNPTVEVDVYAMVRGEVKMVGRSAAPSGASTGSNEAKELRDGEPDRFLGKGVRKAVDNVVSILSPALKGQNPLDLTAVDDVMCKTDGTELKEKVGGNAITAASFALAEAGAFLSSEPLYKFLTGVFYRGRILPAKFTLPTPMVNILNGGKHAGGKLKIQEFMIMPAEHFSFAEKVRIITTVYHKLGGVLASKYGPAAKNLGDEGGFAPPLEDADEALKLIEDAIREAGFQPGKEVNLALDCASSEYYNAETKKYEIMPKKFMTGDELLDYYGKLIAAHPALISIEDAFDEKDYDTWKKWTERFGDKIMIVGDDLFTTNTNLIKRGLAEGWANALLLKVNQIGTISEAMKAAQMMFDANKNVIVSHRSGETVSSLISDLAVAIGAKYIKTGAPARGERVAKYNRLLQIEEELAAQGLLSR